VPIRYQVAIEHGEDLLFKGTLSWLLHIIHANISFIDGKLKIKIRIFGKTIFDNSVIKVKKTRVKNIRSKKKTVNESRHKHGKEIVSKKKSEQKEKNNLKEKNIRTEKEKQSKKTETITENKQNDKSKPLDKREHNLDLEVENKLEDTIREIQNTNIPHEIKTKEDTKLNLDEITLKHRELSYEKTSSVGKTLVQESKDLSKEKQMIDEKDSIYKEIDSTDGVEENNESLKEESSSFYQKIKNKVYDFFRRIKEIWKNIIEKLRNFVAILTNIKRIKNLIKDFLDDELNRESIRLLFRSLRKFLRHIAPTKLRSQFVFGTGDPCSTGQVLGVLGILYALYGNNIQITPDFINERFEGKHYAKGRIRLLTLLIIAIKLILDKRIKQFRKNISTLKEAL
jgi:hypothetical protein